MQNQRRDGFEVATRDQHQPESMFERRQMFLSTRPLISAASCAFGLAPLRIATTLRSSDGTLHNSERPAKFRAFTDRGQFWNARFRLVARISLECPRLIP